MNQYVQFMIVPVPSLVKEGEWSLILFVMAHSAVKQQLIKQ